MDDEQLIGDRPTLQSISMCGECLMSTDEFKEHSLAELAKLYVTTSGDPDSVLFPELEVISDAIYERMTTNPPLAELAEAMGQGALPRRIAEYGRQLLAYSKLKDGDLSTLAQCYSPLANVAEGNPDSLFHSTLEILEQLMISRMEVQNHGEKIIPDVQKALALQGEVSTAMECDSLTSQIYSRGMEILAEGPSVAGIWNLRVSGHLPESLMEENAECFQTALEKCVELGWISSITDLLINSKEEKWYAELCSEALPHLIVAMQKRTSGGRAGELDALLDMDVPESIKQEVRRIQGVAGDGETTETQLHLRIYVEDSDLGGLVRFTNLIIPICVGDLDGNTQDGIPVENDTLLQIATNRPKPASPGNESLPRNELGRATGLEVLKRTRTVGVQGTPDKKSFPKKPLPARKAPNPGLSPKGTRLRIALPKGNGK